jgi:hypothetical protein
MLVLPVGCRIADMDLHSPWLVAGGSEVAVPGLPEPKRDAQRLNSWHVGLFILHIHDTDLDVDDRLRLQPRHSG